MSLVESHTLPLSHTQKLFWAGQRLHPKAPLYNMALAFSIDGLINVDRFRAAFRSVVCDNGALRTIFREVGGGPQQVVLDRFEYDLPYVDCSESPDPERAAREWMTAKASVPFDVSQTLTAVALLRLSEHRFVFFLNQHHLVTDAMSCGVVLRRLSEAYRDADRENLDGQTQLPQFDAHLAVLQNISRSPLFERSKRFWTERAGTAGDRLAIYGRPGQAGVTASTRVACLMGDARAQRLRAMAAASQSAFTAHAALFDFFAALLYATLYRTTGVRDQAILVPSHNRSNTTARETAGVFIEMFEHRGAVAPDASFSALLQQVGTDTRQLLKHAVPGSSVSSAGTPNVVLNYITATYDDFAGMPTKSEWIHSGHCDTHHLVRLQVYDFDSTGEFRLYFDLNDSVFTPSLRGRFVSHFLSILDAVLEDPEVRVDEIDLLSKGEMGALAERNETSVDRPAVDVIDRIRETAARCPTVDAIADESAALTYGQLLTAVDIAADRLRSWGLGPGSVIAVAGRRSMDAVIGLLASLATGATYVPVDVGVPRERLKFLLRDSRASLVLTDEDQAHDVLFGVRAIPLEKLLDRGEESATTRSAQSVAGSLGATGRVPGDRIAYVMYTSGSTGEPKGVRVARGALANYVDWAAEHYGQVTRGRVSMPLFTSIAVDLTVTSIFVPLVTGGTCRVYAEDRARPGQEIHRVLADDLVDVIKLTPSHLPLLLSNRETTNRLSALILGGENLKSSLVGDVIERLGSDLRVFNEYGPTEATVGCTIHEYDAAHSYGAYVPIGKPISNMRVLVLNDLLRHVPDGVAGELYVAGDSLAEGYANQPDLTDERFLESVPDHPGRWYRTSDLVYWNDEGDLVFVGRSDEQLKIGGHRVEPGEVEVLLRKLDGIDDAVVTLVHASAEPGQASATSHCTRCGLSTEYPFVTFDADGVCSTCRDFEAVEERAREYFGRVEEFEAIVRRASMGRAAKYDCMLLLSGGKDSTYALYRLVEMGLRVFAFTLDNGYISESAKGNIERVVNDAGVDHEYGTTEAMNVIFVDSLKRFSNVCNGCFKTLYTLAVARAREYGISTIVTGLSRGQFFETRLTEEIFTLPVLDPATIDDAVIAARKVYHRADDAVRRLLDTSVFDTDDIFDEVQFVDFYRYCDATLDELMTFLDRRAPWIRPSDTGRSTNCLINDVGIYVHKLERGFHNYALPYSWDVRMGCKERDEAIDELDDEIDHDAVGRILAEIGYEPVPRLAQLSSERLVAYYVSREVIPDNRLREHLSGQLPHHMIPQAFVRIDAIPVTRSGKLDRSALPVPGAARGADDESFVAPANPIEEKVAEIWRRALHVDRVGVNDNFISIGGTSLVAIQIISRVSSAFRIDLPLQSAFDRPTVAELSDLVEELLIADIQA